MNKLRPRTIRRLAVRAAYKREGVTSGQCRRDFAQLSHGDSNDRPKIFEIQRPDTGGRYRKVKGVERVHTFGLARLRAGRVAHELRSVHGLDADGYGRVRIRNTVTGDVFAV